MKYLKTAVISVFSETRGQNGSVRGQADPQYNTPKRTPIKSVALIVKDKQLHLLSMAVLLEWSSQIK